MKPLHHKSLALILILTTIFGFLQPASAVMAGPNAAPVINIWYGESQSFGHHGQPQHQVNILGDISNSDQLASLTFTLNGGPSQDLSLGPDSRRLLKLGDFNVELYYDELNTGANTVVIEATDKAVPANVTTKTVTVNKVDGSASIPSTIDWSSVTQINNLAQIVDGKWTLGASGVRTVSAEIGYDRLIAIGELDWTNFEVSVPITIHAIDDEYGYDAPSYGPAIGLLLGWTGHTDSPSELEGLQPHEGYMPFGAYGVYRWMVPDDGGDRLRLYVNSDQPADDDGGAWTPSFNVPYIFKMRMEDVPGEGPLYQFKVWQSGGAEPGWMLSGQASDSDPKGGCILLLAHHVDATFGDVTIMPLSNPGTTYTLSVAAPQHGTVSVSPQKASYTPGETVTLTASPEPGWSLSGWTVNGQSKGSANPYTFQIQGNTTVSASFTQNLYTLTVSTVGQGTVSPASGSYLHGSKVTLTANPSPGWAFDGWSGGLSGSASSVEVTITGDLAVTAAFSERYTLAVTPAGQGTVSIAPASGPYPSGAKVILTANPSPGWAFSGWSGDLSGSANPVEVTITGNLAVTATFTRVYRLTVNAAQGGSVSLSPAKAAYAEGEKVTLTAVPAAGWNFAGWGGDISGSSNPLEVVMTRDLSVDAVFVRGQYELSLIVKPLGSGWVNVSPVKTLYQGGEQITLTPIPAQGWGFTGWSGDLTGKTSPVTLTITKDLIITANFARQALFIPLVISPP